MLHFGLFVFTNHLPFQSLCIVFASKDNIDNKLGKNQMIDARITNTSR